MELLSGPCHYGQTLTDLFSLALLHLLQKKPSQKVIVFVISRNSNYVSMMGLSVKTLAQKRFFSQEANIIFPKFLHTSLIKKEVNLPLIYSIKCIFSTFIYQIKKIDRKNVQ